MAEQFAASARDKRDALWGQLMAASALEMNEARDILDVLESTADQTDRYEIVRMADKKLGAGTRAGSVGGLANARRVVELVDHVHDPFARCSFRCNYAYSLDLSSFYEDAHEQALLVLADAAEFRVDPALPYAHYVLAIALAGWGDTPTPIESWITQFASRDDAATTSDYRTPLQVECGFSSRRDGRLRRARSSLQICRVPCDLCAERSSPRAGWHL